jgi:glycine oxidase
VQSIDFLIVGQGIAGSCLALEFLKRGISFLVIDKTYPNSASRVAAGLFNPITGKTMESTWRAAELFPHLIKFYQHAEHLTEKQFLRQLPIYRPFLSDDEQIRWQKSKHEFVAAAHMQSQHSDFVNDSFGGLELNHSGFLNTQVFLSAVRQLLQSDNRLMDEEFLFDGLHLEKKQYRNLLFNQLIFCDGVAANQNPFFNWLPIKKLKGETLTIKIELPQDVVFNRGVFAVPTADSNLFLIGSTYSHDIEPGNTEKGVTELVTKAKTLFKKDFKLLSKNWGFRPTSPDRRPIIGRHAEYKNLLAFNGLGTKGVSLAPFFAVQLVDHLLGLSELEPATNIERFYSLYFQFREKAKA